MITIDNHVVTFLIIKSRTVRGSCHISNSLLSRWTSAEVNIPVVCDLALLKDVETTAATCLRRRYRSYWHSSHPECIELGGSFGMVFQGGAKPSHLILCRLIIAIKEGLH